MLSIIFNFFSKLKIFIYEDNEHTATLLKEVYQYQKLNKTNLKEVFVLYILVRKLFSKIFLNLMPSLTKHL